MEDFCINFITNISNSFDFSFCIVTNITTYLFIKSLKDIKRSIKITTWQKRIIFLCIALIISVIYKLTGSDYKILFNSIIISPVTWSWILKPICKKLNIDYSNKSIA